MTDLSQLEALARAATPGPWYHRQKGELAGDGTERDWIGDHPDFGRHSKLIVQRNSLHGGSPDYAYIAAANPAAILALIERLRKAEAALPGVPRRLTAEEKEAVLNGLEGFPAYRAAKATP